MKQDYNLYIPYSKKKLDLEILPNFSQLFETRTRVLVQNFFVEKSVTEKNTLKKHETLEM